MVTDNEWPVLPDGRLTPTLLQTVPLTAEIVRCYKLWFFFLPGSVENLTCGLCQI